MSDFPTEDLELQAMEQRKQLHERAAELRNKIGAARERLDPRRNAREHFSGLAALATAVGLLTGYAAAGMFTNK